jgi:hypothetical protein
MVAQTCLDVTLYVHYLSCSFMFVLSSVCTGCVQVQIKLFGTPRQWKNFHPLFQAVFPPPGGIKHYVSQSQDRNIKYFIL